MDIWGQILMVTIPALIVLFVTFYLVKFQFDLETKIKHLELGSKNNVKRKGKKYINYQAYERLVLYLERINPSNLALRLHKNGMTARTLESDMVRAISSEYEHNLSQQIYFSDEIWMLITKAKEETIQLIGLGAKNMTTTSTAMDLSKILINLSNEVPELPHNVAIKYLKQELRDKAAG